MYVFRNVVARWHNNFAVETQFILRVLLMLHVTLNCIKILSVAHQFPYGKFMSKLMQIIHSSF